MRFKEKRNGLALTDWGKDEEARSGGWSAISAVHSDVCRCLVELASYVQAKTMNVGEGKQNTATLPFLSLSLSPILLLSSVLFSFLGGFVLLVWIL